MRVEGRDIVVISIHQWNIAGGSNVKDIANEFSKHNRVLFVERPLDRKSVLFNRKNENVRRVNAIRNGINSGLTKQKENLWIFQPSILLESINRIKPEWLHTFLNKRNNKIFADSIVEVMKQLGFSQIILFNDSEMINGFFLKEYLNPALFIYYIRDNLIHNPYWRKHGKYLEPKLIKKADMVATNSGYYADYAKKYNLNSFVVGQGCNLSGFNQNEPEFPLALKNITPPLVGYVGFLSSRRLDIGLIEYLAKSNPDLNFVLVGEEDEHFKRSDLHRVKNVLFTGIIKPKEVPSYINAFDVCINPQQISPVTIGNYPRKIDEYLAMGKPVVATFTEAMLYFKDVVYLAKTKKEFASFIKSAIKNDNQTKHNNRIRIAQSHTWEQSVRMIYAAIDKVENEKYG